MDDKIEIGSLTLQEYNIIMKQLSAGQLGECIELFMRFRALGIAHQELQQRGAQAQQTQTLPPPGLGAIAPVTAGSPHKPV